MRITTLTSLLALAAMVPAMSHAADGNITINGRITDNTCNISSGTTGKHVVTLPTVSTNALAHQNDVAGRTQVTITLNNCNPASGKVGLFFEPGAGTDMANGYLKNGATSGSNVEVQLLNADLSTIALNADQAGQHGQSVDLSSGAASLSYFAQYIAAAGAATAGDVKASTDFTIIYP